MLDVITRLAPDLLDYHEGWALQRELHAAVVAGAEGSLVLCEHEPVFTAGKRTVADERPTDGTPVVDVDRGGKITWHGPGQLTGYPIVRLHEPGSREPVPEGRTARPSGRATGVDVVAFVRDLETMMIAVAADFGVTGERVEGRSGVWVRTAGGWDKIGAIGLRVQEGVTMHGFALNCSNDLAPYAAIVPCGIRDAGVTSLSMLTGRTITPADVVPSVLRHLDEVLVAPAVAA
ncbi:MAG TPA: lipoyl(octanoyl) transferase LipB [Amnibacterium sp.]|jgi:lipoyl(octanoyl) transferase|uniref:lipoyl(octanoyl) transferase LipB n=1 Tax=Amnibacterium sp. TaxID=1872496 RepID=UPI002F93FA42